MKKIEKVITLVLVISMSMLIFGCSKKEDVYDIDINSLCNELIENVEFEDELNAVDNNVIKKLYSIDDYEEAQLYISTGATAEEIAVFKFQDKASAGDGLKKAQERIENQKEDFETYIPKEVKKLDNAIMKQYGQYGQYVVVCVSNDSGAETIIEKYFGK